MEGKPRVVSVTEKAVLKRAPPETEGYKILESYGGQSAMAGSAGNEGKEKTAGFLGGIMGRLRSLFKF